MSTLAFAELVRNAHHLDRVLIAMDLHHQVKVAGVTVAEGMLPFLTFPIHLLFAKHRYYVVIHHSVNKNNN